MSEYTPEEIARLKEQEKRRETNKLVVNQKDFETVAKPGRRINMGEVRKDSPALEWFKDMTDKPAGKGMLKYVLPNEVKEKVLNQECPVCGGSLDTTDLRSVFNCPKCNQNYAMELK